MTGNQDSTRWSRGTDRGYDLWWYPLFEYNYENKYKNQNLQKKEEQCSKDEHAYF